VGSPNGRNMCAITNYLHARPAPTELHHHIEHRLQEKVSPARARTFLVSAASRSSI
jgi:hypothetical protein